MTATRGYSVILNDMHGKPKATWAYGGSLPVTNDELELTTDILESQNRISGQEYLYRLDANNKLDNEVEVITPEGTIATATIGIEAEMAMDFREHYSKATRVEVQGNVDTWIIPFPLIPPIVLPTVWGNFSDETTRFRSAVATKLINQHGLLDKARAYDHGAIVETQNLLYDALTGEVLVTSVNNEYRDKLLDVDPVNSEENLLYTMKYPAHWAYDGMQHAYQNIGVEADVLVMADGTIEIDDAAELFQPGDELAAAGIAFIGGPFPIGIPAAEKFWVCEVNAGSIKVIDRRGLLLTPGYLHLGLPTLPNWNIKIIRSGFRNQQSAPIANMTSLKNPADQIIDGNTSGSDPLTSQATDLEVLDFSAQEFGNVWDGFCGTEGLDSTIVDVDLEICSECADVVFVIDISGSVDAWEFTSMRNDIINTIQGLDGQEGGDYRYSIFYFNSVGTLEIPFTSDAEEASNFFTNTGGSTDLNTSLQAVEDYLIEEDSLNPDRTCPVNIAIFTDATGNQIAPYDNSIDLKEYNATIGVVRYRQGFAASSDPQGAATASPGWIYNGLVDNNNYDSNILPRRFIPTDFGSPVPSIATVLNCQDTTITDVVYSPILCGVGEGDIVNPFVNGIRGNWRLTKSYVHNHVPRVQASINGPDGVDAANNGYYSEFDQFWNIPTGSGLWTPDPSNYITTTEVTKYNPYGQALESEDALGVFSSALLGYDKKLAIAVGANTKYQEMAFDGFEEYAYYIDPSICHANYHLDLDAEDFVTMEDAHTGYYSFKVEAGNTESRFIALDCYNSPPATGYTTTPFQIEKCKDCLTTFNPIYRTESGAENRYVFDAWVKEGATDNSITIGIKPEGVAEVTYTFEPKGPVIDGWQRIYEFFELEPNTEQINISFNNAGASSPMFVDDIRFYPFDANMKSFVYHPSSLKLVAELDENNHAIFYEYDEEWNLIRIKQETERGIMTLQENRSHVQLKRN